MSKPRMSCEWCIEPAVAELPMPICAKHAAAYPEALALGVVEQLRARVEELECLVELTGDDRDRSVQTASDALMDVYAERDALRAALRRYGFHLRGCQIGDVISERSFCTCGLGAALGEAGEG